MEEIIEFYKKGIDESLLDESLKLTYDQRLERLEQATEFFYEVHHCANK